ncbi:hypothetical protein AJ88_45580 [Mesorhizobium amorphae CCBAU 01583]|nr:hypothetical protein AJ88_45580 [Mesorhizobium amorphae CCBAU 01583]
MKDREAELAEALEKSRLAEAVIKRRETEAEEARKNLATVLESLPAAVIIYDRDDNFVFANRKLQDTLPALKSAWQPGRSFREALELGHSAGYFRLSGDADIDRLYDGDLGIWLDATSPATDCPTPATSASIPTAAGTRSTTCGPTTAPLSGCASTFPTSRAARRRCTTRCARSTCSGTSWTNCL